MRPLSDTRVLDLSRLLPGPFATLVLADLGATVDKIEDVTGGDLLRHISPQIAGESAAFQLLNRGKRSALLDLKKPEGRDAFRRLVATYDAGHVGENYYCVMEFIDGTDLTKLVRDHGRPAFVKIDVEGFEDRVLMGLSQPVPALSFEFTTIARDVAARCLDRLAALGPYGFDVSLGEAQALTFGCWVSRDEMAAHLAGLPHEANSGDVYAVLNS